jgi:hypothetical protein
VVAHAHEDEEAGAADGVLHMGAELRVGSVMVLPAAAATALLSPSRPGPPSIQVCEPGAWLGMTTTSTMFVAPHDGLSWPRPKTSLAMSEG